MVSERIEPHLRSGMRCSGMRRCFPNMFIHCTDTFAIMAATRCGHTNMYHYFGIEEYSRDWSVEVLPWKNHHNSIVVLRNPLDRVVSAMLHYASLRVDNETDREHSFVYHSSPYMRRMLTGCNFRIIDFYDLDQYIPRRTDVFQSPVTYSRVDETTTVEDVYVQNSHYTLEELQQEFDTYKYLMANKERISIVEWKELTQ